MFEELEAKNAHAGQRFQQDEREYFYAEAELSSDEPSRATRSIQQFGESPHPDGGRATASAATRSFSCDGPQTRLVRMRQESLLSRVFPCSRRPDFPVTEQRLKFKPLR
ncbi:MAG: hypothetical protein ABIY39_01980 [Sphingomonas sp.]